MGKNPPLLVTLREDNSSQFLYMKAQVVLKFQIKRAYEFFARDTRILNPLKLSRRFVKLYQNETSEQGAQGES